MRTAEELIFKKYLPVFYHDSPDSMGTAYKKKDVIAAMREYALEAIKEDRKNVAQHSTTKVESQLFPDGMNYKYIVDKDSIINAPMIELF